MSVFLYEAAQTNEHKTRRLNGTLANVETIMLETIALLLLIVWALGLVGSYSLGGFIHILLVAAIIMIVVRVIQGRRL